MHPLANKTLALLIQLPPSLHIFEGLERLRDLVPTFDSGFRYAVEVRHRSWFQNLAYNFFANNYICFVWSQLIYKQNLLGFPIRGVAQILLSMTDDRLCQRSINFIMQSLVFTELLQF